MGIPIQETALPYDVDVLQKVPMPPNRDTVGQSYLQDIAAETLNAIHEIMETERFSETWVRTAIEDDRVSDSAVVMTKEKRYGENVAMWSTDTDANMKAAEAGYQVVHPRTMSAEEREKMRGPGGIQSTKELFGRDEPEENEETEAELNPVREAFATWVAEIGKMNNLTPKVRFVRAPKAKIIACCTANTDHPTVTFNLSYLSDRWLEERGALQMELVIHELAHAVSNTPMEHGPKWGEACSLIGAQVWAAATPDTQEGR